MKAVKLVLKPLKNKPAVDGQTPLHIAYGTIEDHFNRAAEKYDADREVYLNSFIEDPDLLIKSKQWQKSSRRLASWAETWFMTHLDNKEEQQNALDILDRITKDSSIRNRNIWSHADHIKKTSKDPKTDGARVEKAEADADNFLRSAIKTQHHYNEIFEKGGYAVSVELEEDLASSIQLARTKHLIPDGQLWRQAMIFPPARIPVGEPVPDYPEVYNRILWMDPEDLEYHEETGELLPKKGYISEDGLVDDQSVVFHPETNTVDMGYRGGVKVTWNYWMPHTARDTLPPDSWCVQYNRRLYWQNIAKRQRSILEYRDYEDEVPEYDVIPSGSVVSG